MNSKAHALVLVLLIQIWTSSLAQQCGRQAGNKVCPNGLCCSEFGYCGNTDPYCGKNCQSQCGGGGGSSPGGQGVASIITNAVFNQFLSSRSNGACPANGFYTYNAFIQAASSFSGFGTTGAADTMKQELAAFFANAAHETSSGCYKEEIDQSDPHCSPSAQWPCNPNKKYYGRGPLQISWNYNYGPAGNVIGFDGINNPEIVATDPVISFKSAIWFWMTPQSPKPSCHNAMVNNQGFGETINIINGGFECGKGTNSAQQDRINLYTSFCQTLGVQPGNNLGC